VTRESLLGQLLYPAPISEYIAEEIDQSHGYEPNTREPIILPAVIPPLTRLNLHSVNEGANECGVSNGGI
jgi:hypothetical protein